MRFMTSTKMAKFVHWILEAAEPPDYTHPSHHTNAARQVDEKDCNQRHCWSRYEWGCSARSSWTTDHVRWCSHWLSWRQLRFYSELLDEFNIWITWCNAAILVNNVKQALLLFLYNKYTYQPSGSTFILMIKLSRSSNIKLLKTVGLTIFMKCIHILHSVKTIHKTWFTKHHFYCCL